MGNWELGHSGAAAAGHPEAAGYLEAADHLRVEARSQAGNILYNVAASGQDASLEQASFPFADDPAQAYLHGAYPREEPTPRPVARRTHVVGVGACRKQGSRIHSQDAGSHPIAARGARKGVETEPEVDRPPA